MSWLEVSSTMTFYFILFYLFYLDYSIDLSSLIILIAISLDKRDAPHWSERLYLIITGSYNKMLKSCHALN
jgi:hypothetical protein